jgi:Icc-related predicted phosphoesterase
VQKQLIEIGAIGDLHCTKNSAGRLQPYFAQLAGRLDVLVLCGDLTDLGTVEEAKLLASELAPVVGVPKVAVLGNHDYESGHQDEVRKILADTGTVVLDGEAVEIAGVGFAGAKGFAGGFGRSMLTPWGEPAIKMFVDEGVKESMKLESALAKLRTAVKVAVTHYSPILDTVRGEPPEILAWLGNSRLEESINRFGATLAFHGHAHKGTPHGHTREGIPVFNCAAPLLRRTVSETLPVRFVTVDVSGKLVAPELEAQVNGRPGEGAEAHAPH